jgi:hypothetical protein
LKNATCKSWGSCPFKTKSKNRRKQWWWAWSS